VKLASILREALRNVRSGTARAISSGALFLLLVCALNAADMTIIQSIHDEAQEFQDAGASIITFEASGQIDGDACKALTGIGTIRAAGALRAAEPVRLAVLPDGAVPTYEITPGLLTVLGVGPVGPGLVISDQVAEMTGAVSGDELATAEGVARIAEVYSYPSDGRRSGFGYAALKPVMSSAPFDECWVEAWPTSPQTSAIVRSTLIPSEDGGQGSYAQLNGTHGSQFEGERLFRERLTRIVPVVAFASGAALAALLVRMRRLSHASALHAGASHGDLLSIWAAETICWISPGILAAMGVTAFFAVRSPGQDAVTLLIAGAATPLAALAGIAWGGMWAHLSIRERHLFRYFADR